MVQRGTRGGFPDTEPQREGGREARRWQLGGGAVEAGEAAVAAAAAVAAGEAFGSHNGKHSFSLRVSVHQGRGPGGGGLCELTANTRAFSC